MAWRIDKYNVPAPGTAGRFTITMPQNAELLGVGTEAGTPVVWALGNTQAPTEDRRFIAVHTGDTIPRYQEGTPFLGTAISGTGVIWHVFDGGGSSD